SFQVDSRQPIPPSRDSSLSFARLVAKRIKSYASALCRLPAPMQYSQYTFRETPLPPESSLPPESWLSRALSLSPGLSLSRTLLLSGVPDGTAVTPVFPFTADR